MNILGDVPHDGIGTFPDTGVQHPVDEHAEILRFINDHMMGLADHLRLLNSPVQKGKRRQVIDVKFPIRDLYLRALFSLLLQKFPVQIINGTFPHLFPVPAPVGLQDGFSFLFRIFNALSQKFLFDLIFQALVEHVDLVLHGNGGILPDIPLHRVPVHQFHRFPRRGRTAARFVKYSCFSVLKAFHKLSGIQVYAPSGNGLPFQRVAKGVQRLKPLRCSPFPAARVRPVRRPDPVFFIVPVLVQKPHEKLFHGHLPHAVYVQIRKHAGDILQQDPVTSHNVKILRLKPLLIVIKDVGDPVHGHRGFPRSRHALYDHVVVGRTADDIILLLLNGSDDFSQHGLLVFCQILRQQIVIGHHLGIVKIQQPSILNFIGTLSLQVNFDPSASRHGIAAFSKSVFIIGIRHRRAPVHHHPVSGIL